MRSSIIAYFDGHDKAAEHYPGKILRVTAFGAYAPTPLKPLEECTRQLISERSIPESGMIVDAGCGDGRIVALMSNIGYDAYGLEGDRVLAQQGKKNIEAL